MQEKNILVDRGIPRTPASYNLDTPFPDHGRMFGRVGNSAWPGLTAGRPAGNDVAVRPLPFPSASEDFYNEAMNGVIDQQTAFSERIANASASAEQKWAAFSDPAPHNAARYTSAISALEQLITHYDAQSETAHHIDGHNLFYLAETLALRKVREMLMSGSTDPVGDYNALQNQLKTSYAAALEQKLTSLELNQLAERLSALGNELTAALSGQPAEQLNSLHQGLSRELDIHLQRLPSFLQQSVRDRAAAAPTQPLGARLTALHTTVSAMAAENRAAVAPYDKHNPNIQPPLSRPELQALKNLVDLQAERKLGPRWAPYHVATLHGEAARQLETLASSLTNLAQREQTIATAIAAEHALAEAARQAAVQKAVEDAARQQAEENAAREAAEAQALSAHHALFDKVPATRVLAFTPSAYLPVLESAAQVLEAALSKGVGLVNNLLREGVGQVSQFATLNPARFAVAALLYSPKLGNAELPRHLVVTVPLETLSPEAGRDVTAAQTPDHVVLPARLALATHPVQENKAALVVAPSGAETPVKVVAATYDTAAKHYTVRTTDQPPRTLTWTPAASPPDASTTLPAETTVPENYEGPVVEPVDATLLDFPQSEPLEFDDVIVVFPADSGMAPIYVMYVSRRNEPGIALGDGVPSTADWLHQATSTGTAVASSVANTLLGRNFGTFNSYRKAFWRAVSLDPVLMEALSPINQALVKAGNAPWVHLSERVGKVRVMYELHHVTPIAQGGDVYNAENIVILTPKAHIEKHASEGKQ